VRTNTAIADVTLVEQLFGKAAFVVVHKIASAFAFTVPSRREQRTIFSGVENLSVQQVTQELAEMICCLRWFGAAAPAANAGRERVDGEPPCRASAWTGPRDEIAACGPGMTLAGCDGRSIWRGAGWERRTRIPSSGAWSCGTDEWWARAGTGARVALTRKSRRWPLQVMPHAGHPST
jgi:hypothetical protein